MEGIRRELRSISASLSNSFASLSRPSNMSASSSLVLAMTVRGLVVTV